MSQCFSGGFANLARARTTGDLPDGSTCGYFSTTATRPAYGCYPENRGRDNVGHSFHFIEALAETGDFARAHQEVLVTDASPDVPLRTSDVFLADLLQRAAAAQGKDSNAFVDGLLRRRATRGLRAQHGSRTGSGPDGALWRARCASWTGRRAPCPLSWSSSIRSRGRSWRRVREPRERGSFLDRAWSGRRARTSRRFATCRRTRRALTSELLGEPAPPPVRTPVDGRLAVLHRRAEVGRVAYRMDVRDGIRTPAPPC
jgi:hypothetical protein